MLTKDVEHGEEMESGVIQKSVIELLLVQLKYGWQNWVIVSVYGPSSENMDDASFGTL